MSDLQTALVAALLLVAATACDSKSEGGEAPTNAQAVAAPTSAATATSAEEETTAQAAPTKEKSRATIDPVPTPETPPELSPEVLAAICEGSDNVDTDSDLPTCKTCPLAAKTRYNTAWTIHYAFPGSFSKKNEKELFVAGPGCIEADRNHAAALVDVSKTPKVIQGLRSTQADVCKSFEWFGRNAVTCVSEYEKRGEIRKVVTFFEVLDGKLQDLKVLDIPFKNSDCTFTGIYRRDLKSFDATTEGSGRTAVTDVRLEFEAKMGTRKSGIHGDCMAIANGEVEVKSIPETFAISITADEGTTVRRTLGDEEPEEIDVDSSGKPKDPTYDLNRKQ